MNRRARHGHRYQRPVASLATRCGVCKDAAACFALEARFTAAAVNQWSVEKICFLGPRTSALANETGRVMALTTGGS